MTRLSKRCRGLDRNEADQIVTLDFDAMASVEPEELTAAGASDQGLFALLQRIAYELSLRNVRLNPQVLELLLTMIFWFFPSPYTLALDRASDREMAELKGDVGRVESRQ